MSTGSTGKGGRRPLRIGKYEVLHHIATGGMGAVYKAHDIELNRDVALKVLSPEQAADPKLSERFRREAKSAARLHHENIAAIYEIGEAAGVSYLALEFVEGIDLHEYISARGRLQADEARELLKQAAKALAHTHSMGVVHRDIKPSNFLITQKDGQPFLKLIDLGLARRTNDQDGRVTRDGSTLGTVDYMSPEQAHDARLADIRSDLYSLGCSFYHMLAGHPPFFEGSLIERLTKHVYVEPPDIHQLNADVPEDLKYILERMLRKRPEERYQTPLELLRDLLNPEQIQSDMPRLMPLDPPLVEEKKPEAPPAPPKPPSTPAAMQQPPVAARTTSTVDAPSAPAQKPRSARKRPRDEGDVKPTTKETHAKHMLILAGVGGLVFLLLVGIVVVGFNLQHDKPKPPTDTRKPPRSDTSKKNKTTEKTEAPPTKKEPGAKDKTGLQRIPLQDAPEAAARQLTDFSGPETEVGGERRGVSAPCFRAMA